MLENESTFTVRVQEWVWNQKKVSSKERNVNSEERRMGETRNETLQSIVDTPTTIHRIRNLQFSKERSFEVQFSDRSNNKALQRTMQQLRLRFFHNKLVMAEKMR
jgi:hypothetical protein